MIELHPIDDDSFGKVIELELVEGQEAFVAPNVYTLAEAYVALTTGEFVPLPYAITDGETVVGFIGMAYLPADSASNGGRENGKYEMYRFMIDKRHQGKGELVMKASRGEIEVLDCFPR